MNVRETVCVALFLHERISCFERFPSPKLRNRPKRKKGKQRVLLLITFQQHCSMLHFSSNSLQSSHERTNAHATFASNTLSFVIHSDIQHYAPLLFSVHSSFVQPLFVANTGRAPASALRRARCPKQRPRARVRVRVCVAAETARESLHRLHRQRAISKE